MAEDMTSLECDEQMFVDATDPPEMNGISKDNSEPSSRVNTPKSDVDKQSPTNGHDAASVASSEDHVIQEKESHKEDVIVVDDTPQKNKLTVEKIDDCIVLDDDEEKPKRSSKSKPSITKTSAANSSSDSLRPMAKVISDLGLDLARQQVYKDLIKIQNKKDSQQKLGDKEKKQLDKLVSAYENIVVKNEPFSHDLMKCKMCNFNTESENVMELHREYAHHPQGPTGTNTCECSFCDYATSYPGDFFIHMENVHKKRGRTQTRLTNYACYFCSFETNARKAYHSHLVRCEKSFKLRINLMPTPSDADFPLKPEPVAKKSAAPAPSPPNPFLTAKTGVSMLPAMAKMTPGLPGPNAGPNTGQLFKVGNQIFTLVHSHGQAYLTPLQPGVPGAPRMPVPTGPPAILTKPRGSGHKSATVNEMLVAQAQKAVSSMAPKHPLRGKPIVPKMAQPSITKPRSGSFEVCEICGGFVRDKESLRIHFFYAHKVEFPAEMFAQNKPSLFCDVCKQRFWTYQGLVRHSGQVHSRGTSNGLKSVPSEVVKKVEKSKASCHICGEKKLPLGLLSHMVSRHKQSVRRMIDSFFCFLCRRKFKLTMALRMHTQKCHSDLFCNSAAFDKFAKSLWPEADRKSEDDTTGLKCSRCPRRFPTQEVLTKHYRDVHRNDKEPCCLCGDQVVIGRPFIRHVKSEHCSECSVTLTSLPKEQVDADQAKYEKRQNDLKRKAEGSGESDKENHKRIKLDDKDSADKADSVIEVNAVDSPMEEEEEEKEEEKEEECPVPVVVEDFEEKNKE